MFFSFAILFGLGCAAFWWLWRRRKNLTAQNINPWADVEAINNVLQLGIEQSALVDLDFIGQQNFFGELPTSASGRFVDLDDKTLTVQLLRQNNCQKTYQNADPNTAPNAAPDASYIIDLDAAPDADYDVNQEADHNTHPNANPDTLGRKIFDLARLPGCEVSAFFYVNIADRYFFLRFACLVLNYVDDPRFPLLKLARPHSLKPCQRREHSRWLPEREDIYGLGLWPAKVRLDESLPENGQEQPKILSLPASPADLDAPLLTILPLAHRDFRLVNLSAAGLGLRVKRVLADNIPEFCYIFLSLRNDKTADNATPFNLWLACRHRHCTAATGREAMIAGLQIIRWGHVADAKQAIPWQAMVDKGTVPILHKWILNRQAAELKGQLKNGNL